MGEGVQGDWTPSSAARPGVQGKGVVFVDFGRNKVYAIPEKGEDVMVFDGLEDVAERLCPTVIVVDNLPNKHQNTAAELAKKGTVLLRLRNLKKLAEERENNGIKKTDKDDARLLKTLYLKHPNLFQPISTYPEELEVRALTEMWVELAGQRKSAKHTRTTTGNPVAVKAHKTLQNLVIKMAEEIHREALKLPLYRKAVEELGLKGPTLAYIVSHDWLAFKTLPRDRLEIRYAMTRRPYKRRPLRSRLLILLAKAAVINKHPRYREVYEYYRQKGKKHWPAILRVAKRMLRDLGKLARKYGQQTQEAGPPA